MEVAPRYKLLTLFTLLTLITWRTLSTLLPTVQALEVPFL